MDTHTDRDTQNPSNPLCTLVTADWQTSPILTDGPLLVNQRSVAREQRMPCSNGANQWARVSDKGGVEVGCLCVFVCLQPQRNKWDLCKTGSQHAQILSHSDKYTARTPWEWTPGPLPHADVQQHKHRPSKSISRLITYIRPWSVRTSLQQKDAYNKITLKKDVFSLPCLL